ncbi:zinc-finger domain-containing protein [Ectobacillus polymachus]|uniref:zinc-finger domain-containing protein n=1 Tax=Ectobacillus polymachus TaxID=1508806 RepID=UPI003A882B3B
MRKKELITEVNELLDTYCTGCFLNSYFRKEYGKHYAQTFCIKKCTVGEQLKKYGKELS